MISREVAHETVGTERGRSDGSVRESAGEGGCWSEE